MRHSFQARVLTAAAGLWLIIAMIEPVTLHACAMHGGPAHPHPSAHSPAAHHHDHRAPDGHGHSHDCTCLGTCCGSPTPVQAAWPQRPLLELSRRPSHSAVLGPVRRVRRGATAHARPPSIGPPPLAG